MKKDKEWAQREVDKYLSYERVIEARNALVFAKGVINQLDEPEVKQLERKIKELESFNDELIRDNNQLRNELDNQEVLSHEWVDDNSVYASSDGITEEYVHVDDLQNLLVPKQEEVKRVQIPEWIIEWYQGANNEYSTLEDVFSNLSHDTGYNIMDSEKFRSRIMEYGGYSKMYEALSHIYFGVYEIEKEQRYYVEDDEHSLLCKWESSDGWEVISTIEIANDDLPIEILDFKLTEQEIKDYDERYLAFKVRVEDA